MVYVLFLSTIYFLIKLRKIIQDNKQYNTITSGGVTIKEGKAPSSFIIVIFSMLTYIIAVPLMIVTDIYHRFDLSNAFWAYGLLGVFVIYLPFVLIFVSKDGKVHEYEI